LRMEAPIEPEGVAFSIAEDDALPNVCEHGSPESFAGCDGTAALRWGFVWADCDGGAADGAGGHAGVRGRIAQAATLARTGQFKRRRRSIAR